MNGRGSSSGILPRWLAVSLGLWTSLALAQDAALPASAPSGVAPGVPVGVVGPDPSAPSPPIAFEPPLVEAPANEAQAGSSEPAPPASAIVPFTAELASELDAYLDAAIAAFHVPGAAVALIRGGEVAYLGTAGVRDAEGAELVGLDTRFMIGSVTKSMTTTMAATLVGEGRLGWDDRVIDYLPGLSLASPEWAPELRVRDLFRHTSGVPRSDIALLIGEARPLELIRSVALIPGAVAPGERYEYQNQMFSIGGFAAASAVGAPLSDGALGFVYERLMQRRVFEPLDMARTTLDFDVALRDDDHASPHAYDAEAASVRPLPVAFERALLQVLPAGGVWSNVVDMAHYFAMHLREGESLDGVRVVPETNLLETHTPEVPIAGNLSYGLGWLIDETPSGNVLTHDGGTAGFTARLIGLPALDLGLVVLVNRTGGGSFLEAITRYVFELTFGAPHTGDADLLEASTQLELAALELLAATVPVDPVVVAGYTGRYERQLGVRGSGDDLIVSSVYGDLRFRAVPGFADAFLCIDNAFLGFAAVFASDAQGTVTLSIGVADFQSGSLVQPVSVARLGDERPAADLAPARPRHTPLDFRLVPVPHLAPHLAPHSRHSWGPR
jgi:CubicO group peptidase (beta-lactamase class C family)